MSIRREFILKNTYDPSRIWHPKKSFERKYQELFDEIVSSNHYWSCDEGFGSDKILKKFQIENFENYWPEKRKIRQRQNAIIKVTAKWIRSFWLIHFLNLSGTVQSSNSGQIPIAVQEQLWNEILVMFSELSRLVHWKSWDNPSSDVTWQLKAI